MFNKETIRQFITWTNVVGIISIVTGALSALGGVFAFLVGAIPGVIMIIMGIKLLNAKKSAEELLSMEDEALAAASFNKLLSEVTTYFKIQGILYIVSIAMVVIGVIFSFTMMATIFSTMQSF